MDIVAAGEAFAFDEGRVGILFRHLPQAGPDLGAALDGFQRGVPGPIASMPAPPHAAGTRPTRVAWVSSSSWTAKSRPSPKPALPWFRWSGWAAGRQRVQPRGRGHLMVPWPPKTMTPGTGLRSPFRRGSPGRTQPWPAMFD